MKLPEKIKVGGHWIEIKYPHIFQERHDRWGQCDDAKKVIYITNKDQNGEDRNESAVIVTFIHEVLHALDNHSGHEIFMGENGEKKIEGLSEAIYMFLVDNGYLKPITRNPKEVQDVSK